MNNSIYSISSIAVAENIYFDFSQRIKSLNMLFDYNEYIFPVIYIDALLTIDEYRKITERSDLRISVSLKRYTSSSIDNSSLQTFEYCFKDKVFCIAHENNYYMTNNVSENSSVDSTQSNMVTARFLLISEEDLNSNKVNLSGSFANCTVKSLLIYMMNQLNQSKKTIIAEPDNNTVLPQVLIPFNNVLNTFKYLDTVYGIYNNGIKVFFDLNANYLLNKNRNNFESADISKRVIIDIPSASNVGTYDLKQNTITVFGKDLSFDRSNSLKSEFTGNNNSFVMNNEAHTILKKKWETEADTKQKVYYQKYSNPFTKNQINPENDTLIVARCQNADYNLINFINEYAIHEYRQDTFKDITLSLLKYNHKFVRTRDNTFELYTSMSFKKI